MITVIATLQLHIARNYFIQQEANEDEQQPMYAHPQIIVQQLTKLINYI
jgi:hypothetical protein